MSRPATLQDALPGIWRICRRFRPEIARHRRLIAGSTGALVAEMALRLLEPWPLKLVFDQVLTPSHRPRLSLPLVDRLDPATLVTVSAVAVVVFVGLRALATYAHTVGFALVGNRVLTEVRTTLYRHLQLLSLSYHNKARTGDLVVRVIGDVGVLQDVFITALIPLVTSAVVLVAMLGLMFWMEWRLGIVAVAVVPLMWLSATRLGGRIREASRQQRKREGAMAAAAAESMGSIKAVQALSLESAFAETFSSQNVKSLRDGVRAKRLSATLERTVDLLIACATALVLWYGARLAMAARITPGDLLVFLAYLKNAFKPAQDLAKYTARIAKASAAAERVLDVLDHTPDIRDLPGARPAPALRGAVRFDRVGFEYEHGRAALQDIDFDLPGGSRLALVGPSGAGKSTIATLLLRLYDPTTGTISIDGHDLRGLTLGSLRAQVSVVLQETLLFAASVRDNIAYGSPGVSDREIEAAARLANAHEFILGMPQGYDTPVGERGITLSAGQRQRLAIARAAVRQAPLAIFDEPTTGLDRENERMVMEALNRLSEGRTSVLVTHNLRQAVDAHLILLVEGGRVIERGTHAALMRCGGRYAAIYALQSMTDSTTRRQVADAIGA
jgi:ATP-binding cassette subfamily B protein